MNWSFDYMSRWDSEDRFDNVDEFDRFLLKYCEEIPKNARMAFERFREDALFGGGVTYVKMLDDDDPLVREHAYRWISLLYPNPPEYEPLKAPASEGLLTEIEEHIKK